MILSLGLMFGVIYFGIGLIERIPVIGSYARYLEVINQFEGGTFQRLFMWALLGFLWIFRRRDDKEASRLLVLCTFGAIFRCCSAAIWAAGWPNISIYSCVYAHL